MEPPMAVYYTQYLYVYKLFFNMCVGLGLNVFECLYAAQRQELRCRRSTVLEHFASETPSAGRWICYISALLNTHLFKCDPGA